MEQLTDKVFSALASVKHVSREQITLDSSLQDLGLDSLDKVTLLFELEKQFQLSISDEELRSIQHVRDIVDAIARLTADAAPGSEASGDSP